MKSDLYQSVGALILKVGSGISAYLLFIVISKATGTTDFGKFGMLFSLAVLIGIAGSMGLQVFVVREVPKQRAINDHAKERGVYIFAAKLLVFSAVPTALLYVGTARLLTTDAAPVTLGLGALVAVMYAISQATFGMLRVQQATQVAVLTRDLLWRLLSIPLVLLLAPLLSGPDIGLFPLAALLLPIIGLHLALIVRHFRAIPRSNTPTREHDWIKSSAGLGLVGVISSADFYIYTVLVGVFLSAPEAGLFFAALKTAELLNMFLMAVTLVIGPNLAHLVAIEDRAKLQLHCNVGLTLQTAPIIVSLILLIPMSGLVLGLFDPLYAQDWPLLLALASIMLFNALTGATGLLMQLAHMHWLQVRLQGGFLFLSIALLPPLTQLYGIYGVALSFALSKVLWNIAAIYFIRRQLGVDPSVFGLLRTEGGGVAGVLSELRQQALLRRGSV